MAKVWQIFLVALPFALTTGAPSSRAAGTTARVEVPISQRQLSNGTLRYSVPVRINDGPDIDAMLDTGSFGLRVMQEVASTQQYHPLPVARPYPFDSGVVFEGMLTKANVAVGGAETGAPVVFQIVQSVHCGELKPHCPAATLAAADYRIGGEGLPGEGYAAILGVSMRAPQVPSPALNPLDFIGDRRWIIALPRPGDAAPGQLIINPDKNEMSGFKYFPLALHRGAAGRGQELSDRQAPGCLDGQATDQNNCQPVPMDSGARNALQPFYSYLVLYDQKRGVVGFKRRE